MTSSRIIKIGIYVFASLILTSCIGGSDGGFSGLGSGGLSDVSELTIIQTTPAGDNLTINTGSSQTFTILAQTPPPASVNYYFTVNGTTVSNTNSYTVNGTTVSNLPLDLGIGNHTVTANATDGTSTKSKSWTLKVNGPPQIIPSYSTSPKITYNHNLNLSITATDPNGDAITYEWRVGDSAAGATTHATLQFTNNTAVFTPTSSMVGKKVIKVIATDTSNASSEYSFDVHVTAFNNACNTLSQYSMCTYVGTPSLGDGLNPASVTDQTYIKIRPIAVTQDPSNGNLLISDNQHNLVWYWNRTSSPVNRLGFTGANAIPANTIKVVAGTGEAASGGGDNALDLPVNSPRGLFFDYVSDSNHKLYIAESGANRVKVVTHTGFATYQLGTGAAHSDNTNVTTHACNTPVGMAHHNGILYIACNAHHRVKAWDLSTDNVYTVYGNGTATTTYPNSPTGNNPSPYNLAVTSDGLFITHYANHIVRHCNFSGANKTWFGTTINNGECGTILGTNGSNSYGTFGGNPRTNAFAAPAGIAAVGDLIFVSTLGNGTAGEKDSVVLLNNSAVANSDYGVTVNAGTFDAITATTQGYSDGTTVSTKRVTNPYDIHIDITDNKIIYVADTGNNRLRSLNFSGTNIASTVVGSGRLRNDDVGYEGFAQEIFTSSPSGLVWDTLVSSDPALYYSDTGNARIQKVDKFGNVTRAVGGGGHTPTLVNNSLPNAVQLSLGVSINTGLAAFLDGTMVITNRGYYNFLVWNRTSTDRSYLDVYTGAGRVNNLAGTPTTTQAANSCYRANPANMVDGVSSFDYGNGPLGAVVTAVNTITDEKEIIFAEDYRHCIKRVASDGTVTTLAGVCQDSFSGSCVAPWTANTLGTWNTTLGVDGNNTEAPTNHIFNRPTGMAIHYPSATDATNGGGNPANLNGNGNIIVADHSNHKIRYINRSGTAVEFANVVIPNNTVKTIACEFGNLSPPTTNLAENAYATVSRCSSPSSVALNDQYLCYSQRGRHNVRCIRLTGVDKGKVFTVAGSVETSSTTLGIPYSTQYEGDPAVLQKLYTPSDIIFDSNGDLYISDLNNHLIRKVKLSP